MLKKALLDRPPTDVKKGTSKSITYIRTGTSKQRFGIIYITTRITVCGLIPYAYHTYSGMIHLYIYSRVAAPCDEGELERAELGHDCSIEYTHSELGKDKLTYYNSTSYLTATQRL